MISVTGWLLPLRRLPPETAHRLAIRAAGLAPPLPVPRSPRLRTRLGPLELPHPLGLAAGFDKNGEAVDGLLRLGFSFVEIGTVTPRPQRGNPRPRLFRLPEDRALVNRMGFNNAGMERVATALRRRRRRHGVVGINIGINRDSEDPVADYRRVYERLAPLADYLVVNVSSPNTPGLRALQAAARLRPILENLAEAAADLHPAPPLFVKIAPDLGDGELEALVETAVACGVAGLVVGNTTVRRPPGLRSPLAAEEGGLSGRPLFPPSTELLRKTARLARGRLCLVGCGGIFDGADAYAKIRAGASALQIFTALVFRGPGVIREILRGLEARLAADGFARLGEAVGVDLG